VDKVDRRYEDEGRRGQAKRCARIGTTCDRKGGYTTTGSTHGSRSRSTIDRGRSGENEGSKKYPTAKIGTTARRSSVGNWRVGYGAG
jgi:hypothetical protein